MKKWLVTLGGLTAALATVGAVSVFALTGAGTSAPEREALGPSGEPNTGSQAPVNIIDIADSERCNFVHNINACFAEGEPPSNIPVEEYTGVLSLAAFDLAKRLGFDDSGSIALSEIERVAWENTALGNPQAGVAYAEVIVPGFRMLLEADGGPYVYHTSTDRVVFVGQAPGEGPTPNSEPVAPVQGIHTSNDIESQLQERPKQHKLEESPPTGLDGVLVPYPIRAHSCNGPGGTAPVLGEGNAKSAAISCSYRIGDGIGDLDQGPGGQVVQDHSIDEGVVPDDVVEVGEPTTVVLDLGPIDPNGPQLSPDTKVTGSPIPTLKFEGVPYAYAEYSPVAPNAEHSDLSWPRAQINAEDMEFVGTTINANTHWTHAQRLQGFLRVYRLKGDETGDIYTFTPAESWTNPEDGETYSSSAAWTRWTPE